MLLDADAFKIGGSPLAILHDPGNGEQYVMGFNHPAIIPGTFLLVDFSEKNTSTLYDRSEEGNNLSGTSISAALYKDTIFGVAYDFPGAADYFSIADNPSISPTKQITIEAIVNVDSTSGTRMIIRKASTYSLFISGEIYGEIFDATVEKRVNGITSLSTGKWYHFAFTYDGITLKVFINGKLDATLAYSGDIDDTANTLYMGSSNGASGFLDGKMAVVRICNRALKPHEFMHHWYFNTLVNGSFNSDGAVLFDPQVSAFRARKVFTVQADWDSRGQMKSSNIIVNNIRGVPDESFVPMQNDPQLIDPGCFPLIDDHTVGMWILDGSLNEDGKVIDLSAEANHGNLVSLAVADLLNSRFGRYYNLDGAADYISIDDVDVLSFGDGSNDSPFSIEALIKMDDATSFEIISKGVYNTDAEWHFLVENNDYLYFYIFDESVADCYRGRQCSLPVLTSYEGKWIHVAVTYNGNGACSGVKLYLNGLRVDNLDVTGGAYVAMENLTHDVWIGRYNTNYADGQIAFVRISNVVREADEIAHNAQLLHRANAQFQDLEAAGELL